VGGVRKPYQGVWNIFRFNWHYYALSLSLVALVLFFQGDFDNSIRMASDIILAFILGVSFISLAVSFYIYDCSDLYRLSWLVPLKQGSEETILNVNAGFDETSNLLKSRFENSKILVVDFYNPKTHTEISIKRARMAYAIFPGTQAITTSYLPMRDGSADKIFAILSAHEIRDSQERAVFFKEIERILKTSGQVIVVEHLRDIANFLAYNIGFMHFHSRGSWLETFRSSGLTIVKELKITPFITTFILEKNGASF
jgi:SAM-dependent methyltransferase